MGKINKNKKNLKKNGKYSSPEKDLSKELLPKIVTPKAIISKKEKFREKRKNLMKKFAQLKKQRKEETARLHRSKAAIVGDLMPLKDALPSLDELYKLSREKKDKLLDSQDLNDTTERISQRKKAKLKKEKFVEKVKLFEATIQNKDFKKNPRELISNFIHQNYMQLDNNYE